MHWGICNLKCLLGLLPNKINKINCQFVLDMIKKEEFYDFNNLASSLNKRHHLEALGNKLIQILIFISPSL